MTAALTPPRTDRPHLQLVPTGDDVVEPVDVRDLLVTLAAVVVAVLVMVAAVAVGRGAFADVVPEAPASAASGATVVAQPGDTMWTIARRVQPGTDVRALVDELVALNGTALQPGQEVRLPG